MYVPAVRSGACDLVVHDCGCDVQRMIPRLRTSRVELPCPDGLFVADYTIATAFKELAD